MFMLQHKEKDLLTHRCPPRVFGLHKYLIEIDGNVNSWGLLWKLLSGSCILKVKSPRRQWFHHKLQAYVNMVPISADLSDLKEKLEWCKNNQEQCARIAAAGQSLANHEVRNLGKRVKEAIDALASQKSL